MLINEKDNVIVDIATGHKNARRDIKEGEKVIKYGYPIGIAKCDIAEGEHVHSHNIRTGLEGILDYKYEPSYKTLEKKETRYFSGYVREDGSVGIRNDIWIVNTVGCVNGVAKTLAEKTGALAITHPFGCSQLGDDMSVTQKVLRGLVNHPNAGGVLVLGLGCENNNIPLFKTVLGEYDAKRVRFLECQGVEDEIEEGIKIIEELKEYASRFERTKVEVARLKVGLKCGGSDGYSGITANPLVGRFTDKLVDCGGCAVMTEVPEMFGAETILMERCIDETVFDKTVSLINNYKNYFASHDQPVYENPSPGNKAGGITTLEEKSLGCITKGGTATVVDVIGYGETAQNHGLTLLDGPGNDIVACTNLTAAGCHIILFTTGRGTPLGAPVPTVKVATNPSLAGKKSNWIDFNAGSLLSGDDLDEDFFNYVISVANGEKTKNEINKFQEISIFKDGVVL